MLNKMKWFALVLAILVVSVAPTFAQERTIADIVIAGDDFSTLEAAVIAAGLAETLSDPEAQFTVFAPTDGAFRTLLVELNLSAADLLANEELLTTVLLYHVLPGEVKAADVVAAIPFEATTVQGEPIAIGGDPSGRVGLNNGRATVSAVDVDASNGVIHVIDNVIIPPSVLAALAGN
jgi:transforming growth factor-beta-induced protein